MPPRLNQRKWGRVWECDELLDLVEDFERTVEGGGETDESPALRLENRVVLRSRRRTG